MNRRGLLKSIVAGIAGLVWPWRAKAESKSRITVTIPNDALYPHWRNYTLMYNEEAKRKIVEAWDKAVLNGELRPPIER